MKIISINIGKENIISTKKSNQQPTGFFKTPTGGPVTVGEMGLEGDFIANKKHHGGPDQAIYIYGQADYASWVDSLGEMVTPGLFGENLTISGLESANFNVGDMMIIGEVHLQVSGTRSPCSKFSTKIGDPQFVKKFWEVERPGLYCRVLQTGTIQIGDTVSIQPYSGETVSILELYRDARTPDKSEAALRRFLAAPISIRTRTKKEDLLAEIQS